MYKIAFVIPWYGEGIPGGAEMELREVAGHLQKAGVEVEVLTTCVKDFTADWNQNYYAAGVAMVYDVPTRRFPVRKRDTATFDRINAQLMQGKHITPKEEVLFLQEMVNSPQLYEYIETHNDDYDLFVFMPYMFGTTFHGVLACPEKAVMIPCFHEEAYAHMRLFRQTYINIRGMIFNSVPEMKLANRLYDLDEVEQICMGIGMDTSISGDGAAFREKYGITDPYLIYAGRKDSGKNVHTLLQYFAEYKKRNPEDSLQLVLIGGGTIAVPNSVNMMPCRGHCSSANPRKTRVSRWSLWKAGCVADPFWCILPVQSRKTLLSRRKAVCILTAILNLKAACSGWNVIRQKPNSSGRMADNSSLPTLIGTW